MDKHLKTISDYVSKNGIIEWDTLFLVGNRKVRHAVQYLLMYDKVDDLVEVTGLTRGKIKEWKRTFQSDMVKDVWNDVYEIRAKRVKELTDLLEELEQEKQKLIELRDNSDDPNAIAYIKLTRDIIYINKSQKEIISEIGTFEGSKSPTKNQTASLQVHVGGQSLNANAIELELKRMLLSGDETDARKQVAAELLGRLNTDLEEGTSGTSENILLEG